MILKYKNSDIEYEIVKRRRKTICIKVDEEGSVSVITPLGVPNEKIKLVSRWLLMVKDELSFDISENNKI